MTDYSSQPELDDELVSAYLDGELSAEDRAAVEARLSADPAAAELIQQLRAVSQAMQGLPQEVVGHDLSDAIVRRVEESRRTTPAPPVSGSSPSAVQASSSNGAASPVSQAMPTLTIGRTRRGWVWASLAVAAALLIMVFQSDPDPDQNLPSMAQRDRPAADRTLDAHLAQDKLEIRALHEPAVPAATDLAVRDATQPTAPDAESLETRSIRGGAQPAGPPAPSDGAAATGRSRRFVTEPASEPAVAPRPQGAIPTVTLNVEQQADLDAAAPAAPAGAVATQEANGTAADTPMGDLAAAPPAAGLGGERQEGVSEMSASAESPQPGGEDQLVVVHVMARRTALENKRFEQLLTTNGIQIDEAPVAERANETAPLGRQAVREREARRARAPVAQEQQDATPEEEVVLVEAAPTTIMSCLESLKRDEENYMGIKVDDSTDRDLLRETVSAAAKDFAVIEPADKPKKLAEELDLARFNRGVVPVKQDLPTRDKEFYYRYYNWAAPDDRYAGAGGYGAGYGRYGGRGGLEEAQQQLADSFGGQAPQVTKSWGRAVRLRLNTPELPQLRMLQADEKVTPGEAPPAESPPADSFEKLTQLQSEHKSTAGPQPGTLQVLFVLQPAEETAPSRPSRNKAQ
jgi:anti-sigma factor RsiW